MVSRRGRRENHLAFVAVHWGDSSNARHAIPPDVDVPKTSGGKRRSLSVLCVLKRSGREMLVTLCIIYNYYRALYEKSLQNLKKLTDSSAEKDDISVIGITRLPDPAHSSCPLQGRSN